MAVDALLEDTQLLAHRGDLPEEDLDRDRLLLRPCLARLHDELAAGPALADLARDGLLGVQHRAHGLDDAAQVFVVEGRHQRTSFSTAFGICFATRTIGMPVCTFSFISCMQRGRSSKA